MAGRPQIKQADLNAMRKLAKSLNKTPVDMRHIVAYVMHYCGASYEEIGITFEISRQMAKTLVDQTEGAL